jgi:hypothetical protein
MKVCHSSYYKWKYADKDLYRGMIPIYVGRKHPDLRDEVSGLFGVKIWDRIAVPHDPRTSVGYFFRYRIENLDIGELFVLFSGVLKLGKDVVFLCDEINPCIRKLYADMFMQYKSEGIDRGLLDEFVNVIRQSSFRGIPVYFSKYYKDFTLCYRKNSLLIFAVDKDGRNRVVGLDLSHISSFNLYRIPLSEEFKRERVMSDVLVNNLMEEVLIGFAAGDR